MSNAVPVTVRARAAVLGLFIVVALAVSGCAAKLVPPYDQAIVDGLTQTNEQALTLFESVSGGADKASFAAREGDYNALIGKAEATRSLIEVRPMPQGKIAKNLSGDTPPSDKSLGKILETLRRMKGLHGDGRLSSTQVGLLKNEFVISMGQALTYENALKQQ